MRNELEIVNNTEVAARNDLPHQSHPRYSARRRTALFLSVLALLIVAFCVWPVLAAVELNYYTVVSSTNAVLLDWSTRNENNLQGFQVLCKQEGQSDESYHPIGFRSAANPRSVDGNVKLYDWLVNTGLSPGVGYCFRLREVTANGEPGQIFDRCGYGLNMTPTPTLEAQFIQATAAAVSAAATSTALALPPALTGTVPISGSTVVTDPTLLIMTATAVAQQLATLQQQQIQQLQLQQQQIQQQIQQVQQGQLLQQQGISPLPTPLLPPTAVPIDPNTGLPIVAPTPVPIDPNTGLPIVAPAAVPIDPNTGLPIVAPTAVPIDPNTGLPIVAPTPVPIDPNTGLPIVPTPIQPQQTITAAQSTLPVSDVGAASINQDPNVAMPGTDPNVAAIVTPIPAGDPNFVDPNITAAGVPTADPNLIAPVSPLDPNVTAATNTGQVVSPDAPINPAPIVDSAAQQNLLLTPATVEIPTVDPNLVNNGVANIALPSVENGQVPTQPLPVQDVQQPITTPLEVVPNTSYAVITAAPPTLAPVTPQPTLTPLPTLIPTPQSVSIFSNFSTANSQGLLILLVIVVFLGASGIGILGVLSGVLYVRARGDRRRRYDYY